MSAETISMAIGARWVSIGHQGESGVTDVRVDLGAWERTYGEGTASVWHLRPGEETAYPVPVSDTGTHDWYEFSDGVLTWHVGAFATEVAGKGLAEIRYTLDDGLKISSEIRTYVDRCSMEPGEMGEVEHGYIDSMTEIAAQVLANAGDDGRSAEAALGYRDAAGGFAGDAERYAGRAGDSAESAAESAEQARASIDNARYVYFDVSEEDGILYVIKSGDVSDLYFTLDESTGELMLEVT